MEKESQTHQNNMNALYCSNVFNPSWENAADQSGGVDFFESALSSMVSSPTASNINGNVGDDAVLRELIGRLGSICNSSGEISPHQPHNIQSNNSNNTSCYSTPLNSPPKLNLSTMMVENSRRQIRENMNYHYRNQYSNFLPPFSADPGFAERAARFSCFANKNLGGFKPQLDSSSSSFSRTVSSSDREQISVCDQKLETSETANDFCINSTENSTVSEQINGQNDMKKRKSNTSGKEKEKPPLTNLAKDAPSVKSETSAKRMKSEDGNEEDPAKFFKPDSKRKQSKDDPKTSEPPKDYIHVRARRGQATDAHSLAERVRREKIGERMKLLQDLVPGCNKVTGKALMLDEIINYVQSLQRQVEFLSMKMATINPRMDFNMEALVSKDMFQSLGSFPHYTYAPDSFLLQSQANPQSFVQNVMDPFFQENRSSQSLSRISTFLEDDLHGVVQMGFQKN